MLNKSHLDKPNVGSSIHGASAKVTPVDADTLPLIDSAAANVLKKVTWANIKATLKTYFDTFYNLYVHPNHSGDVTSVADGATTIGAAKVTLAMMANMATARLLGRNTAETGVPEVLTVAQVTALLNAGGAVYNGLTRLGIADATVTAWGMYALLVNIGSGNIAFGLNALKDNTNGYQNTAIGEDALRKNVSGFSNLAIGNAALYTNTGNYNIAIGETTLIGNTSGYQNIAIGRAAMGSNKTGSYNIGIGGGGVLHLNTGSGNVGIGGSALWSNKDGNNNVGIGMSALESNNGDSNVAIGYQAGLSAIGVSGCVFIGYKAGYYETTSNKLYIDNSNTTTPLIWGDFANDILIFNGKAGIGITPTAILHLKAGAVDVGAAPLKFAAGVNLTTPEAGAVEFSSDILYITDSGLVRREIFKQGGMDIPIVDGGTGQGTAQAAIDALTAVTGATNEHVLTKDTASGNAIFKASGGGVTQAEVIMWATVFGS